MSLSMTLFIDSTNLIRINRHLFTRDLDRHWLTDVKITTPAITTVHCISSTKNLIYRL